MKDPSMSKKATQEVKKGDVVSYMSQRGPLVEQVGLAVKVWQKSPRMNLPYVEILLPDGSIEDVWTNFVTVVG